MNTEKPTPPEGYQLLTWLQLPDHIPAETKFWREDRLEWQISKCLGDDKKRICPDVWYALPVQKPVCRDFDIHDRPTPPEGYELMLGSAFTDDVPIGTKAWLGARWSGGFLERQEAYQMLPDIWYAVPIPKAAADPKAVAAARKPQLQLIPPVLSVETAKAFSCGAAKYGIFNWRTNKVEMMIYLGAMKRHIDMLIDGEDVDPDSGAHHLGCVAAGCGIVLDARQHGTLVDNRPPSTNPKP